MPPFRSIRVRLTLWYVLLLAVILGVFSAGVYVALRVSLYNNLDDSVDSRAQVLLEVTAFNGGRPTLTTADAPTDPQGEQFARVFDASGNLTFDNSAADAPAPIDQDAVSRALQGRVSHQTETTPGDDLRVLTMPIQRDATIVGALQVGL